MKIFITGGNGFIGRNLKEQLGCRYDITAPASNELDLINDCKVMDFIKRQKFDVIIHAANWNPTLKSKKDATKIVEYNLKMFFNIVRCSEYYGKLIYFGSGAEFGRSHWIPMMDEEYFDKHVPCEDYGFSKYVMTKYAERAENIFNLRLFGVFGKYERWERRFISNACCKAVYDLPITIKQNVFFDFLYIDDLVKITDLFIVNEPREKVYNICTGKVIDLLSLAKEIAIISGNKSDIVIEKPGLGREYSGNNAKFTSEFGVFPFNGRHSSIKYLYDWYVVNKDVIDREELITDSSINFESERFIK